MPAEKNKCLFLLGGHDLEMIEIRNLLDAAVIPYIDRNLSWGARLSSYQDVLSENANKFEFIYGIELIQDIEFPVNYILIDHHNENAKKEASIEQVATLLEIELNDYQRMVAANDKGYIPAMVELGATSENIHEIRRKDRQAQGVTEEDEELAKESLKNAEHFKDVISVKSLTSKFSAVSDRLYPHEKFIVYNDAKLTYYGHFIKYLKEEFKDLINQNKAYCGGNPLGFFGIAENALSAEQLEEMHQKILGMTTKPFSHHIFSFPFKIDIKKTKSELKSIPISERVDLKEIKDHFLSIRLDDNLSIWEEGNDQYHPLFFNFSNYFYPFALEAMSGRPESSGHSKDKRDG
ncbi:MAG: hypothetical protein FJY07_10130, partial [Bacteroidetes bacterium]|nr:hypothetical protein [Bacteroidota bacterium]